MDSFFNIATYTKAKNMYFIYLKKCIKSMFTHGWDEACSKKHIYWVICITLLSSTLNRIFWFNSALGSNLQIHPHNSANTPLEQAPEHAG